MGSAMDWWMKKYGDRIPEIADTLSRSDDDSVYHEGLGRRVSMYGVEGMSGEEEQLQAAADNVSLGVWRQRLVREAKRQQAKRRQHLFPPEDVEASRQDAELQAKHSIDEEERKSIAANIREDEESGHALLSSCPDCERPLEELDWVYFRSPDWTWAEMCGREGWLVVCSQDDRHLHFFMTKMN